MSNRMKLIILAILSVVLILLFLFYDVGSNWSYVLPRRGTKIFAIVLTGGVIAFSTMIFQTVTNNRILTPSILGLDALYMLIQTFVIFVFGSSSLTVIDQHVNFGVSVVLMILFSAILYKLLFQQPEQNIYILLLVGLIFGTFFGSLTDFMQVLIDPNEFLVVQDRMFASFNNVNTDLLWLALGLTILVLAYSWHLLKYLDVLSLGKEQAVNLGVNYDYVVKRLLVVVVILVSVSTALVGPITFLGLLVANVAHEFLKTYRHVWLILGATLISIIALIGGQFIVEQIFVFSTSLSVIINFVGGIYFLYLLLKESKAW